MYTLHFAKNRRVPAESQLILNKFQVYKTLIIQIKRTEKKEKCSKQKAECLFSHEHIQL